MPDTDTPTDKPAETLEGAHADQGPAPHPAVELLAGAGADMVDRLAWHLFLEGLDLTDPDTVTSAYRTWNCARSGERRRTGHRIVAAKMLAAAFGQPILPLPLDDGEECGRLANGVVIYRRNKWQRGLPG
jgi:hypothetical protein